jgi:hypothetical protein
VAGSALQVLLAFQKTGEVSDGLCKT